MNYKVVCAWCNKVLKDGDDAYVSHGICEDCETKLEYPNETHQPDSPPKRSSKAPPTHY